MSIVIDKTKCVGCGKCVHICPGNVLRQDVQKKAYPEDPSDCWNCVSCMKECPVQAISILLPMEISAGGGRMKIRRDGNITAWEMEKTDGEKIVITTDTNEANKY